MSLTSTDQHALLAECKVQWTHQRRRFWRVYLPESDWDDLRAVAFARVLSKAERRYNPAKGGLDAWVGTVIRKSIINGLRPLIGARPRSEPSRELSRARPIELRVIRDRWGADRVTVSPDIEAGGPSRLAQLDLDGFRQSLNPPLRRALDTVIEGDSLGAMMKDLGLRHYVQLHAQVDALKGQWTAYHSPRARGYRVTATRACTTQHLSADLLAKAKAARAVRKIGQHGPRKPRAATPVPVSDFLHLTPIP